MQRLNRVFDVALIVSLIAVSTIGGISAYFIDRNETVNRFAMGDCSIEILEEFNNPDIEPNEITTITKKVMVRNVGENCCAVRIRANFSTEDVLSYTSVDYNTEFWLYNSEDGYWYYRYPLKVSQSESEDDLTQPLFTRLVIDKPTPEEVKDFEVYVYAEGRNCNADDDPIKIWEAC